MYFNDFIVRLAKQKVSWVFCSTKDLKNDALGNLSFLTYVNNPLRTLEITFLNLHISEFENFLEEHQLPPPPYSSSHLTFGTHFCASHPGFSP